ncbi:MAG: hypothetical protein ACRC1W_05790, partial [Shewanella sp.]
MALIGNYSLQNRTPTRILGAGVALMTAVNYSPHSSQKNRFSAFGQLSGTPYGYLAPISWVLPNRPGAMSSFSSDLLQLVKLDADAKMGRGLIGSAALTLVKANAQADQ